MNLTLRNNFFHLLFLISSRGFKGLLALCIICCFIFAAPSHAYSGWGACNLGIFTDANSAREAAAEKAKQLWPPEPNVDRYWQSAGDGYSYYNHNGGRYLTKYYYPTTGRRGGIWGGSYFSKSWISCSISSSCPNGYESLNDACVQSCANDEVRNADGHCECPAGAACFAQNSGQPPCAAGGVSVGNPINAATGNKYQEEVDYIDSINPLLRIRRTYNSYSERKGLFGNNWSFEFESNISFVPPSSIPVAGPSKIRTIRGDGKTLFFTRHSGAWHSDSDFKDTVLGWGNAGWDYIRPESGITEKYDKDGLLTRIQSVSGFGANFIYSPMASAYPGVPVGGAC